jgi:aminoglycoside phosphotransferase (APT) family kinase protein
MSSHASRHPASLIAALHLAVARLVAHPAGRRPGVASDVAVGPLCVRSLRRKQGRGVVAVYHAARPRSPGITLVTATVAEEALSSRQLPPLLAGLSPDGWQGPWPGIVHSPSPGVRVQAFPSDAELPALAAAVDMTAGSQLRGALADVAAELTGNPRAELASADIDVVRYRPGARCVLRYRVDAEHPAPGRLDVDGSRVIYGKLYRQQGDAHAAHALAERLWSSATIGGAASLPRPLTIVAELGLVLSEAASDGRGAGVAGRTLLRPATGSAGEQALQTAGEALAWWHTAEVDPGPRLGRTATTESRRAHDRLDGLVTSTAGQPSMLRGIGEALLTALAGAHCERLVLVHGAFRPNQLVFVGPCRAAITDLDGAGPGDPAVDVGTFCAHLRPPGVWYGDAGQRAWWDAARRVFVDRYGAAMVSAGAVPAEVAATLRRASLFEASSILKMAGHRSRRLNSRRPGEVVAMLAEVEQCLARYHMRERDLR